MEHEPIIASSSNQYLPKDIVCGVPSGIRRRQQFTKFCIYGEWDDKKKILLQVDFVIKGILISQALLHVVLPEDGTFK